MRSRLETGNILGSSGVPVAELRASIVIGSGSASFELIRALVERLPVMLTPRWVRTAAQPIGIEDVISYLVEAMRVDAKDGLIVEIGFLSRSAGGILRDFSVEGSESKNSPLSLVPSERGRSHRPAVLRLA
jgi:hypothetical protein